MTSTFIPAQASSAVAFDVAERLWRLLVGNALSGHAGPEDVRAACMVGIARASHGRARTGELCALSVDDVDVVAGAVTVTHRRPGPAAGPAYRQTYVLDETTLAVVRRWLAVREIVQSSLEGDRVRALFVTVRPAQQHGRLYRTGLPIHPRGLQRAWQRQAVRLNGRHAGRVGWPLPRRFEPIRRAWR